MQLSSSILGLTQPLHHLLPVIRTSGCGAVELSWPQVERDLARARDRNAALHTLLDEHGLELSAIELSPLAATDEPQLHENIVIIRQQMISAQDMGAAAVSLLSGDRRGQSRELLYRGIEAALARAEALGLDLCVANAYGTRIEQIEDLTQLYMKLNHPRLKVLIDTGRFHESVVSPREAVKAFGDRIGAVRLGDRKGRRPVALGHGESNMAAVLEALRDLGRPPPLILEPPPPGERPVAWWTQAREFVQARVGSQ